jgi:glycosyltransferase involved in cell wall biosynthesis
MLKNIVIPDIGIGWLPGAIWTGRKVIQRQRIDIITSSSPLNSTHLIAGILADLTNTAWLADFRDGWLFEPLNRSYYESRLRFNIEQRMEAWVAGRSDAITTVSEPITTYFRETYPADVKYFTMFNGYDPADWSNLPSIERDVSIFRIVHTGAFAFSRSSTTRSPEPLFQALASLPSSIRSKLQLILVGSLTEHERALIGQYGISAITHEIGQVLRQESLAYQLTADCLLLMVGKDRSVATSKLYEYLYAKRPILALSSPDTAAASIIHDTDAGVCVPPDDPAQIGQAIVAYFQQWEKGVLTSASQGIERFERRELTKQLADLLFLLLQNRL